MRKIFLTNIIILLQLYCILLLHTQKNGLGWVHFHINIQYLQFTRVWLLDGFLLSILIYSATLQCTFAALLSLRVFENQIFANFNGFQSNYNDVDDLEST